MKLTVSLKSDKPIYEQIFNQIVSQIISGELEADFCLPSIRSVAKELCISVITIKTAYEMLEQNGFIYTRAGVGCFVAAHSPKHLENRKLEIASTKIQEDIVYYKGLGIAKEELLGLIKKLF